jgi:phage terminase small subunit
MRKKSKGKGTLARAGLTPKQARFVAEYLVDLNATQAAIRAGYSENTARAIGSENLTKPDIAEAIAVGKQEQLKVAGVSAERVLDELRRLAFVDLREFFDAAGNMKPMADMTADQGAALAGMEVIIKNAEAGDGKTDRVHKFKVWDKTRSLEMLAKHFGVLVEQVRHSGALEVRWKGEA